MGWWEDLTDDGSSLLDDFLYTGTGSDKTIDWSKLISTGGGIAALAGVFDSEQPKTGYQGSIPKYEPIRARVANTYDPDRRPGSGGQRYFSDTRFSTPDTEAGDVTAAQAQATALEAANLVNPAKQLRPTPPVSIQAPVSETAIASPASGVAQLLPVPDAETLVTESDGNVAFASGGIVDSPRAQQGIGFLNGAQDGMRDTRQTTINNNQPAALSDGEFVVPSDVVSHLGNGNSSAGAQQLYDMMDRIRQARTGSASQGPQINPQSYMPR